MTKRNGHVPTDELGREPAPPLATIPDVDVPKTPEELAHKISHGVARALAIATTAKDLTDAVKVGTEWFRVLYPTKEADPAAGYGGELVDKGATK